MKPFLPLALVATLALAGCGAAPSAIVPSSPGNTFSAKGALPADLQKRIQRGEVKWLYGGFTTATVLRIQGKGDRRVFTFKAGPSGEWDIRGTFKAHVAESEQAEALKVGDKVHLFINYPFIDVKTNRLLDTGSPYIVSAR